MSQKKLKVVHFASGDLWAGAEVQLFSLCSALKKIEKLTVKVILLNEGKLAEQLRKISLEVVIFNETELNSLQLYFKVKEQLKIWRPDILHTHRQKENIIGGLAARLCKIKSIRTIHGAPEHYSSWRKPHKSFLIFADRWVARYLQKNIISVSIELTSKLTPIFTSTNITTIENGVDLALLEPFKKEPVILFNKSPIKIGFVGRLVPVKRVDRFIDTAKILVNDSSIGDCLFYIYGDGPLKKELQLKIEEKQLESQVFLKGHHDNILECIRELDLLLITSEHEGLPITLLEAMAIGTPVISASVGNIPHVLSQGAFGTLVEDPAPKSFSSSIEYCISNPSETRNQCLGALQQVTQNYSSNRNAREVLNCYHTLL